MSERALVATSTSYVEVDVIRPGREFSVTTLPSKKIGYGITHLSTGALVAMGAPDECMRLVRWLERFETLPPFDLRNYRNVERELGEMRRVCASGEEP